MSSKLDYLSFFGVLIYLVLNSILENKWINLALIPLLLLPALKFAWNDNMNITILMIIINLVIGFSTIYPKFDNKEEEQSSDTSIIAIILFSIAGLIAFFINKYEGEPCGGANSELLCNKTFIMCYILLSFAVYSFIKLLRKNGWWPFNSASNNKSELFNILVLSIWQLYIYLLLDGFKDTSLMSSSSSSMYGGGLQTMYKIFSYMSLVVLAGLFISNSLLSASTESDTLKGIKELQYNLITTTILTMIIIPLI